MTLREFFEKNNTDIIEIVLTDEFYVFIQNYQYDDLCIELCNYDGDSRNMCCNISIDTDIDTIKDYVLNKFIKYYYRMGVENNE